MMNWRPLKLKGRFRLPNSRETPRTFVAKRQRAEAKITPLSLIHPATANALLIMGTREQKCFFNLKHFLIWSGTSALCIYVLSVVSKYVLWWILNLGATTTDRIVLLIIEFLSLILAAIEVLALSICSFFLYPELVKGIDTNDESHPRYCDYGTVWFSTIFFTMMWVIIFLGTVAFLFTSGLRWFGFVKKTAPKKLPGYASAPSSESEDVEQGYKASESEKPTSAAEESTRKSSPMRPSPSPSRSVRFTSPLSPEERSGQETRRMITSPSESKK